MMEFVLDSEPPTDVMGFGPQVIEPGSVVIIQTIPQRPFRPFGLFIPREICAGLFIQDLKIGVDSQFITSGPITAELFAWTCTHDDCEGLVDGEVVPLDHSLMIMKRCIETHPDQPRAVRRWNLRAMLVGQMCMLTVQNARAEALTFRAALLGNVFDPTPTRSQFPRPAMTHHAEPVHPDSRTFLPGRRRGEGSGGSSGQE